MYSPLHYSYAHVMLDVIIYYHTCIITELLLTIKCETQVPIKLLRIPNLFFNFIKMPEHK